MKSIAPSGRIVDARNAVGRSFHRHGPRWRLVLPKRGDGQVYPLRFRLMRWQCALPCGATFPHYPPGVLPHKRHVAETMLPVCEGYLQEEEATYRSVVTERGVAIVHAGTVVATAESSEEAKEAEKGAPQLRPSTAWWWMRSLAELWKRLRPRWERRQMEADRADLSPWRIAPRKHRSQKRRRELVDCGRVLEVLRKTTDFESMALGP